LTSLAGLSLALGAFLGGMVVADTEYGRRAMGDILPLRDAFVCVFFVSLGMLFDVGIVADHPLLVAGLLAGFLGAKGVLATVAALFMRFPARVAWLAGVGLAQFGEFGFVLTRLAQSGGVIDDSEAGPLLTAGIISMFFTPLLLRAAPHIKAGERLLAPLERLIGVRSIDEVDESTNGRPVQLENHVVIVGFGLAGRFVARTLQACGSQFVVLELDPANVRKGKRLGLPVYYGDATSEEALHHAHLQRARLVVLLMNDPQAAHRVVDTIRRLMPTIPVLMRTRYLVERRNLMALGASDVVAEEVEGAVEIIARLLRSIDVPRNVIDQRIHEVRADTQTSERTHTVPRHRLVDVPHLADLKIESALVHPGSAAVGETPISLRLRSQTGALVVAVWRHDRMLERPDPGDSFTPGDLVYLVGTTDAIARALPYFDPEPSIAPLTDAR
jgi:monovalent cation:H+ antiporter-2, CPA2 family